MMLCVSFGGLKVTFNQTPKNSKCWFIFLGLHHLAVPILLFVAQRTIWDTVKRNSYVDDCLKSVCVEEEGVALVHNLSKLLARGGFHMTEWVSNSAPVVASVPEEERSGSVKDLNFDQPNIQRALGSNWDVVNDEFTFKVMLKERQPTRRELLSIVSPIYDPLGFTAIFILLAKMLMQDLCKMKLNCDDQIDAKHIRLWNIWLKELPKIEQLRIPRCMKPSSLNEIVSTQLHTFADASQRGMVQLFTYDLKISKALLIARL